MYKKLFLLVLFFLVNFHGKAQMQKSYYLVGNNQESLTPVSKEYKEGYTTLKFNSESFTNFLADKKIIKYEKSFPNIKNDYLNKVFTITIEGTIDLEVLNEFSEVIFHSEEIYEGELASLHPNDYMIVPPDRLKRNDYLDLIRAPLAWSVT